MIIGRGVCYALAISLLVPALSSCSGGNDEFIGDYDAGYAAGMKLSFPPSSPREEIQCGRTTMARYDGDGGARVDSGKDATAFWLGCLDAAMGRDSRSSGELVAYFEEEEKEPPGD